MRAIKFHYALLTWDSLLLFSTIITNFLQIIVVSLVVSTGALHSAEHNQRKDDKSSYLHTFSDSVTKRSSTAQTPDTLLCKYIDVFIRTQDKKAS